MKILIGQNHLDTLGGSETFTYTLIKGMLELGHEVDVLCGQANRLGIMSNKIKEDFGINVNHINGGYDLCLLSHQSSVRSLYRIMEEHDLGINKDNIFQICHGAIPSEEQPVILPGLRYIVISREVQKHLEGFNLDSTIIYNPVDLDRFKFTEPKDRVKSIFSLSQSNVFNSMLKSICDRMDIKFTYNNKFTNPIFDVEKVIAEHDMVFSLGRGCYEAMAMGKNVVVADHRPYQDSWSDGIVTTANFWAFMKFNCSGRFSMRETTIEFLEKNILRYNPKNGYDMRKLAEEDFDMIKQCKKFLELAI
tara:strand:+ start:4973 stop:5890 length:918 start_codon:yes stop_codon:yes gene_type:complete